ncbi:MAG: pyridoxal phosphate-dependent aminotransferase [Candidatus Aenigmarchaeota archaeon]|nr:pyridoxal phosphate-dependent aminotransferase [Candidatus Aenigmarchaeota archaeon]
MKLNLARRDKVIEKTKIEESLKIIEQNPDIISLGAGEPDFPAPKNVVKSAEKFLEKGYTHYSPPQGRHELREALVKKLKKENKIDVDPENIIITCGSKEAILLSVLTTVNPKEEVLIQNPGYVAYRPIVEMLDAIPKYIPLREEDKFEIHPEILKKTITKKTKLLILNTPSNPTGTVLSKKTLEEIADIAIQNNLTIMADEAYEKLIYDNEKHISIASLNGMEDRVITVQSFSKSYAMCGFRIGYAVANERVIKEMTEFKLCTTLAAPTFGQLAAIEALKHSSDYVKKMIKEYDRRRNMMVMRLNEIPGFSCTTPKGAFYTFPNIKEFKISSDKLSDLLLKKSKVMTIPGTEFGKYGEGYLRLSYATAYKKIETALNRIEGYVTKLFK